MNMLFTPRYAVRVANREVHVFSVFCERLCAILADRTIEDRAAVFERVDSDRERRDSGT
jgi:hypothetical protein